MKYRYTITNEGTVEADNNDAAKVEAWEAHDEREGLWILDVEPLDKEKDEG